MSKLPFPVFQSESVSPLVVHDIDLEKVKMNRLTKKRAILVENILTEEECLYYIEESEKVGYKSIEDEYPRSYRDNTRAIIFHQDLATLVWSRVSHLFEKEVRPDSFNTDFWKPIGLNPCWRFCRYEPGGHFAGHYDANYRASPLEQSFYTFMIYLNGDCGGGATNFLDESGNVIHSIKPKAGQALIFHHQIFHNGGRVESNLKYLMRSDAIYRSE